MKKIAFMAVSAAAALCSVTAPASYAAPVKSPSLFFHIDESSDFETLKSGKLYIDRSSVSGDIKLNVQVFLDDDRSDIGMAFAKWRSTEGIELTRLIDPFELAGASPFKEFEKPSDIIFSVSEDKDFQAVGYTMFITEPYTLTGSRVSDYPLAGFEATITGSAPFGEHSISFVNEDSNRCYVLYRLENFESEEVNVSGKYAKPLNIAVSDRMLGDVDGTGKHEASDASLTLEAYSDLASGGKTSLDNAQRAAADVDGDGIITAADASYILTYYSYISGGEKIGLNEFIKSLE